MAEVKRNAAIDRRILWTSFALLTALLASACLGSYARGENTGSPLKTVTPVYPELSPHVLDMRTASPTPTAVPLLSVFPSLADRFGVGVDGVYGQIGQYDVAALGLGWYSNWNYSTKPALGGLDYVQLVAVKPSAYPPDWKALAAAVRENAGALWIIGNEPEGVYGQGERTPPEYAQIYHDLYLFIKGVDPQALVAIGGVIEPTPLRLKWLEQVLDAYQAMYAEPMPVEVWNIHVQILQEKRGDWGAAIPAGLSEEHGRLYTPQDNADPNIFRRLVEEFRQWMKEKGFQDKPLIVSEYGVLMPYCFLVDEAGCVHDLNASIAGRKKALGFMSQTLAYLLNASDMSVGYPADGGRLVQQWLWYSLNEMPYDVNTGLGFSGSLFDWQTREMTDFGTVFSDTVMPVATPYVDLTLRGFTVSPEVVSPGVPFTLTLWARVANRGVTPTVNTRVRFWVDEPGGGGRQVGDDVLVSDSLWRYGPSEEVTAIWPRQVLTAGQHLELYAVVDPDGEVAEAVEDNNRLHRTVWAPRVSLFLPMVQHGPDPISSIGGRPLTVEGVVRDMRAEGGRDLDSEGRGQ